jgi:hypothetical protein
LTWNNLKQIAELQKRLIEDEKKEREDDKNK